MIATSPVLGRLADRGGRPASLAPCCATSSPATTARRGAWPAAATAGARSAGLGPKISARPLLASRPRTCTAGWPSSSTLAQTARGTKINVLGPRGGAKSTIGTLALPLRAAVECREPYIWIVSDTEAPGLRPSGKHQGRIARQPAAGRRFSRRRRPRTGVARQLDRAPQRRDDRGLRHGPADPRPAPPRAPAHADRLRRPAERRPHPLGHCSASTRGAWFHGTLMKAGTPGTNVVNLATALHREALADGTAPHARLDLPHLQVDRPLAARTCRSGSNGKRSTPTSPNPDYQTAAEEFYRATPPGHGRRRDRALARGRRPLHADVHAGRERADRLRAREAELADQSRPVRMARVVLRRDDLVRHVAGQPGA